MPQLSAGQTASIILAPADSYTVSASATTTVKGIYGAPSTTTTLTANFQTFGPYSVPAKLDISCASGMATYSLIGSTLPANWTDETGTALRTPAGGSVGVSLSDADHTDCVLYGDSITNQNFQSDGLNNLFLSKGAIAQGLAYLGTGKILQNFGVSGDTTEEMLARVQAVTALRATQPFRAVVMGGTNDASESVPASTTIANLQSIYSALTGAGIPVDAVIYPQRYNASVSQKIHHGAVAKWHRALRMPNVSVVDAASYIVAADGQVPANYFFDSLMHFSGLGAGLYAYAYYQTRKNFVKPPSGAVTANTDLVTLNVNPLLAGSNASGANGFGFGAGLTGVGPDGGAYASRSGSTLVAVMSKVARSDVKPGEWWRFVVGTAGNAGEYVAASFDTLYRLRLQNGAISYNRVVIGANGAHYRVTVAGTSANTADPSGAWSTVVGAVVVDGTATLQCIPTITPGMTVEAICECAISGLSGVMGAQPRVRAIVYNAAGSQIKIIGAGAWDAGQGLMPRNYPSGPLLYRSPEYTFGADFDLSAATTTTGPHIDLSVALFMDGAATPTFDVGQLALLIK